MPAKTRADYHALARARGWRWLGPFPKNVLEPTRWRCAQGHRWWARYNHVRTGTRCPHCAGKARKTEADYRRLARSRGFTWSGPLPANTHSPGSWTCRAGHSWRAAYTDIAGGNGCPQCAGRARLTPSSFKTLARARGFTWLGPLTNSKGRTAWRCARGHTWHTSANTIAGGHGCPHCAGKARHLEADYHALARQRGLEFLGPWPGSVKTPTRWRCGCGALLVAPYQAVAVRRHHRGCPLARTG